MLIRRATRSDIDEVVDLWKEHMDFHSGMYPLFARSERGHVEFAKFLTKQCTDPDWAVFVAVDDETVVGYCLATLMAYPPVFRIRAFGFIQDMAVSQDFRRRGVGAELLKELCVWFRKRGVRRIELQALIGNEISQSFWRKQGFAPYLNRFAKDIS